MQWSDDKRWQPAWYFSSTEDGKYIVGHFSWAEGTQSEQVFDDVHFACAHFILKEIEDYAQILDERG